MDTLPSEILLRVLQLVPRPSLSKCSQINTFYADFIERNNKLLRKEAVCLKVWNTFDWTNIELLGETIRVCFKLNSSQIEIEGRNILSIVDSIQSITGIQSNNSNRFEYTDLHQIIFEFFRIINTKANIYEIDIVTAPFILREAIIQALFNLKITVIMFNTSNFVNVAQQAQEIRLLGSKFVTIQNGKQEAEKLISILPPNTNFFGGSGLLDPVIAVNKIRDWYTSTWKNACVTMLLSGVPEWQRLLKEFKAIQKSGSDDHGEIFEIERPNDKAVLHIQLQVKRSMISRTMFSMKSVSISENCL